VNQFFYSDNIFDETIILPKEEAHHALQVLRKNIGDTIITVDGKGGLYESIIDSDNVNNCKLKIISKKDNYEKPNHYIHIAIAPPKSHDRLEWFVEKSVEIGIQEISFIHTQYSERKNIKLNRVIRRATSSMKQSLKSYLPIINDLIPFSSFISSCSNAEKYIGYLGIEGSKFLSNTIYKEKNYCVLIGPEGDFIPEEVNEASSFGFQCISLGKNRLRTETAGIAACHILNIMNEK